jgi:hypothetical protein
MASLPSTIQFSNCFQKARVTGPFSRQIYFWLDAELSSYTSPGVLID